MSFSWQGVSSFESMPSGGQGPDVPRHHSAPSSAPHSAPLPNSSALRSANNMAEFRLSASIPSHLLPSQYSSFHHPTLTSSPHHISSRITHEGVGHFDQTFMRHCRRSRGPRLLPVLVIGGVGLWAYSYVKRDVQDLRNENRALRQTIMTRSNEGPSFNSAAASPIVHDQAGEIRKRSSWASWAHGRRRSDGVDPSPAPEDQRFV
ncbi:hypothetical protein ACM66B_003653 [Microbotryomycetes sp. NB124-2]